jgi:hypothetical protein
MKNSKNMPIVPYLCIWLSIHPSAHNVYRTGEQIFMQFDIWGVLRKSVDMLHFWLKLYASNEQFMRTEYLLG